jgi:hypothetical protein
MPERDNKQLSPEEKEINKILAEAKQAIAKIDADINKLSERGSKDLQYNPPGIPNTNPQQLKKDITNLREMKESVKENAIKDGDKIADKLPAELQKSVKEHIREELDPQKKEPTKEKTRAEQFVHDLGLSKFWGKEDSIPDKAKTPDKGMKESFNKSGGEKEKD